MKFNKLIYAGAKLGSWCFSKEHEQKLKIWMGNDKKIYDNKKKCKDKERMLEHVGTKRKKATQEKRMQL